MKLTKAQKSLLLEMSQQEKSVYLADSYRPGQALFGMGLIEYSGKSEWNLYVVTDAGRLALSETDDTSVAQDTTPIGMRRGRSLNQGNQRGGMPKRLRGTMDIERKRAV